MSNKPDNLVIYKRNAYSGIDELDLSRGIVSLITLGGFRVFTAIPVSPLDYRLEHPTRAKAEYALEGVNHIFDITDDWGAPHRMIIPDSDEMRPIVEENLRRLREAQLLKDRD